MKIARFFHNLGPIRLKIVLLSLMLTILTQAVLGVIGYSYLQSLSRQVEQKRESQVFNTFHKNVLTKLSNVNNLIQVLQTAAFSDFFRDNMNLREEAVVLERKRELMQKIKELQLSNQGVKSVFFIGADRNQASFMFRSDAEGPTAFDYIRLDFLEQLEMDDFFLKSHDRLELFADRELTNLTKADSRSNNLAAQAELAGMSRNLANNLLITNGDANGVLIIVVLDAQFVSACLPDHYSDAYFFSMVNESGTTLWHSGTDEKMAQRMTATGGFEYANYRYISKSQPLTPFTDTLLFARKIQNEQVFSASIVFMFAFLTILTCFTTLGVSLYLSKAMFKPFRMIANELKKQAGRDQANLTAIPAQSFTRAVNRFSTRTNLVLIFVLAVIIPSSVDGILYDRLLKLSVEHQTASSNDEAGRFLETAVKADIDLVNNLINQMAVNEQLQQFMAQRHNDNGWNNQDDHSSSAAVNISMFPGMNEIAYFVLLDDIGHSVYSSIFFNNPDLFSVPRTMLLEQDAPAWISEYKDVFGKTTFSVIKRMYRNHDRNASPNYILLVPKDSVFADLSLPETAFHILDKRRKLLYASEAMAGTDRDNRQTMRWSADIPATGLTLEILFSNAELIAKNKEYYSRFVVVILIVFLCSFLLAILLSSLIVKPLHLLKETMLLVGLGDLDQRIPVQTNNEIGQIIQSYNHMVQQLNTVIRENMRILEENAQNKVRENELISSKIRAELQMLQAQINPHFLYNTLETINMRSIRSGNHEVGIVVTALADLLRYSVSMKGDTVTFEQELKHVENYVSIQQIRLGFSFRFDVDVQERVMECRVLKFILQPIVENSLKHAFAGFDQGGVLRIEARIIQGDDMEIVIRDNGVGMSGLKLADVTRDMMSAYEDQANQEALQAGLGLRNVYQRLRLFYQDRAVMAIESTPMKGTAIRVVFPLLPDLKE